MSVVSVRRFTPGEATTRQGSRPVLDPATVPADPLALFHEWYALARQELPAADAMALATAAEDGRPSARMVLLKTADARGFTFYSGYQSRKGRELAVNPRAALVLYWHALGRQVRIEGGCERMTPEESDAYFDSRPIGSRLSAVASPQSQVIASRNALEARVQELARVCRHGRVPRPAEWGGYRVVPEMIEFWQSAPHRLHDRVRYLRDARDGWTIERLAP
ncbi:MAG: pyridoxamine 5'-phosphate oxidase [Actinobacteria bacterium]|nr:MAG: pyridoxamine 5'-phosphate oxidase [Actinomycetota bacterium]